MFLVVRCGVFGFACLCVVAFRCVFVVLFICGFDDTGWCIEVFVGVISCCSGLLLFVGVMLFV